MAVSEVLRLAVQLCKSLLGYRRLLVLAVWLRCDQPFPEFTLLDQIDTAV